MVMTKTTETRSEWTEAPAAPGNYTMNTLSEWEERDARAREYLGLTDRRLPRWDYVALLVAWAGWSILVWIWAQ
uniref:Uncharacterized protein n=1 Tax=viral metagenome TaxID=1070528 RepID=A0A6M3IY60_9ZZZZ